MSGYVVLFPADDETAWLAGTDADHQATYDTDAELAERLRTAGGVVTGGAGLDDSSRARTMRRGPGSTTLVTDRPLAETVEQLSGSTSSLRR